MKQNLVFLIGIPRSGTTLLTKVLGLHPEIHAVSEPWIMLAIEALGRAPASNPCDAQLLRLAVDAFLGSGRIKHLRAAAHAIYASVLGDRPETIFVDKTPRYHLILPFLRDVFPEARFIVILRDPFDIAASYKATWNIDIAKMMSTTSLNPNLFDFIFGLRRIAEMQRSNNTHVLHYEALVSSPLHALRDLLAFLRLGCSNIESILEWPKVQDGAVLFGDPKLANTTRIHRESVGSNASILTDGERATLLRGLGPDLLTDLGYSDHLSSAWAKGVEDKSPELYDHVLRHLARSDGSDRGSRSQSDVARLDVELAEFNQDREAGLAMGNQIAQAI